MSKKICSVLIALITLLVFISVNVFAAETELLSDYDSNAKSYLSISGTTATCKSNFLIDPTIKTISITQTLQKKTLFWWTDVNTWEKTFNQSNATYTNSQSSLSSGTYRVKSVFTLTDSSGATETITIYSAEKTLG